MITNLEALKKLYEAFGGQVENLADTATNADVIEAIAEVVTTGVTASLPGVTAADNGKVLMVQDGVWKAASIDELPDVTVEDNGKILKVVNAQWAVATN